MELQRHERDLLFKLTSLENKPVRLRKREIWFGGVFGLGFLVVWLFSPRDASVSYIAWLGVIHLLFAAHSVVEHRRFRLIQKLALRLGKQGSSWMDHPG